jgi:hypothetical protein
MSGAEPVTTVEDVQQKEPPLVERAYEVRAEMKVRHIELKSISERLNNVAALSRAEKWGIRYQLLIGTLVGGGVGFIPFIASGPSPVFVGAYVVVLAAALLVAWLHREAATDIAAERADSILAIKEHIDKTMLATETARLRAPTPTRRVEPPGSGPGPPAAPQPAPPSQPEPRDGG